MSTYILARDVDGPYTSDRQTVLFNAATMVYLEVELSGIGGTHVLRGRFSEGNGHYTRNIHLLTLNDPLYNMGSIVLPYLRRCVLHGVAAGIPVIDEIFLSVCLDRFRQDAASVVMVEEIVGEFAHRARPNDLGSLAELSRGSWHDWRQLEAFEVVDGGAAQQEMRAEMSLRARSNNRPAPSWVSAVVPHWYLVVSGRHGGETVTWKLGGDITSIGLAADWCRWWVDRRGLQTSWAQWWEAHDRIVGGNIIQRLDAYRAAAETSLEALRHLDLGNDHVGPDGGVAVVQPGAVVDDRSGAEVPSPRVETDIDASAFARALATNIEAFQRADPSNDF